MNANELLKTLAINTVELNNMAIKNTKTLNKVVQLTSVMSNTIVQINRNVLWLTILGFGYAYYNEHRMRKHKDELDEIRTMLEARNISAED